MEEKRIKELFAQKLDEAEKTLENLKNQAASAKTADIKKMIDKEISVIELSIERAKSIKVSPLKE